MSSPIVPTQSSTGAESPARVVPERTTRAAADKASSSSWAEQLESAVSKRAASDGPPAEVLDQMAHAARTYEALSAQGHELRIVRDDASGRSGIEVHDRQGNLLKRLSVGEACDLLAGVPLDEDGSQ